MNKRQSIKLKYARINYNICDYNYIEDLASYLEEKIPKINDMVKKKRAMFNNIVLFLNNFK